MSTVTALDTIGASPQRAYGAEYPSSRGRCWPQSSRCNSDPLLWCSPGPLRAGTGTGVCSRLRRHWQPCRLGDARFPGMAEGLRRDAVGDAPWPSGVADDAGAGAGSRSCARAGGAQVLTNTAGNSSRIRTEFARGSCPGTPSPATRATPHEHMPLGPVPAMIVASPSPSAIAAGRHCDGPLQ